MEYDLIEHDVYEDFKESVNSKLEKGWQLHGPTQVLNVTNTVFEYGLRTVEHEIKYFQAVKKDPFESYITKEMKMLYEDLKPKEAE